MLTINVPTTKQEALNTLNISKQTMVMCGSKVINSKGVKKVTTLTSAWFALARTKTSENLVKVAQAIAEKPKLIEEK